MSCRMLITGKVKIHPAIDEHLNEMLEKHCRCKRMNKQDYIAECIAKSLGIELNEHYMMDDSVYAKLKISEIDETISVLQNKRAEFETSIR